MFIVGLFDEWCGLLLHFFFFKQKTAYEMRISDWSSDVCSSDLTEIFRQCRRIEQLQEGYRGRGVRDDLPGGDAFARDKPHGDGAPANGFDLRHRRIDADRHAGGVSAAPQGVDRKSTRLNSSH